MGRKSKPIPKGVLKATNKKYKLQRSRYIALNKKGYSQASISRAYGVSQNTVWMALNSWWKPTME